MNLKNNYMSKEIKSLTIGQLIQVLNGMPQHLKVFMSSDTEGNSYSSLNLKYLYGVTEDRKSIILYPFEEHMEYETIDTKADLAYKKAEAEYLKQREARLKNNTK